MRKLARKARISVPTWALLLGARAMRARAPMERASPKTRSESPSMRMAGLILSATVPQALPGMRLFPGRGPGALSVGHP